MHVHLILNSWELVGLFFMYENMMRLKAGEIIICSTNGSLLTADPNITNCILPTLLHTLTNPRSQAIINPSTPNNFCVLVSSMFSGETYMRPTRIADSTATKGTKTSSRGGSSVVGTTGSGGFGSIPFLLVMLSLRGTEYSTQIPGCFSIAVRVETSFKNS